LNKFKINYITPQSYEHLQLGSDWILKCCETGITLSQQFPSEVASITYVPKKYICIHYKTCFKLLVVRHYTHLSSNQIYDSKNWFTLTAV